MHPGRPAWPSHGRPWLAMLRLVMLAAGCLAPLIAVAADDCLAAIVRARWQPFIALTGGPPPARALSRLADIVHVARTVTNHTEPDAATAATEHALWRALRRYDLKALYHALPRADPPWRVLDLTARVAHGIYRVRRSQPGRTALDALGDSRSRVALRPLTDGKTAGDGYALRASWHQNIGVVSWAAIRRAEQLELAGLMQSGPVAAPPAALHAVTEADPRLSTADQALVAQHWVALPATGRWFAGIGRIDSVRARDDETGGARHLDLTVALDAQRLRDNDPAVADYLDQLGDVLAAHIVLRNSRGRWLTLDLNTRKAVLTLDGWLVDGHLVPTQNGHPRADAKPGPPLDRAQFESVAKLTMHALGLTVTLDDLTMHWRYRHAAHGARFSGRLRHKPRVSVDGRALGIVPPGLINAVMPSSIDGVIDDFMATSAGCSASGASS